MCGIVGVFAVRGTPAVSTGVLDAMRDQMRSRGPDDAGSFTHHDGCVAVAFGHRRLSIIDLSAAGHQPMSTADESLWICFNGEIFNYRELRASLVATGKYAFRSQSDTEVVLYGVREWGLEGCLQRLRGMYAFALFDRHDDSLCLVRDPLGVKPLYYVRQPNRTAFASEIKALLALPGVERRIADAALSHYLTFAASPAPLTLFDGILKLEAGSWLRIDREGRTRQVRYWDPARFTPSGKPLREEEYVEELRRLLRQAVARRMVSDVPFGAFLSGGIDSSLNVALMAQMLEGPVQTYSVGVRGDADDDLELQRAREVARHFGANHHELLIDDGDFISALPHIAYCQDEPLADPVCVPIYHLSQLARRSGTPVIQVGEGSDEIFAGYAAYQVFSGPRARGYRAYSSLPRPLRSLFAGLASGMLPPQYEDALRRAVNDDPVFVGNAVAFWDSEKPRLLRGQQSESPVSSEYIRSLAAAAPTDDPLRQVINIELRNRLPELLLMRVDKMSMAHSIETRVPYLDEDLVAFAMTIPSHLKYHRGQTKYVLKRAAEGILPREIIYRKKRGFCGSSTNMLTQRIVSHARERIMDSPLIAERFQRGYIETVFARHRGQQRFNSFKIWNLLNLVLWHETWFAARQEAKAA
jgi:asparagine synthase (glutamine-hydrolysing)